MVAARGGRRRRRRAGRGWALRLSASRRTVALLGVDGPAKAEVRRRLLGRSEEPEVAEQALNRVWCNCDTHAPLTLLEAPGHVDFLSFVDISLRICAGALLVMPFSAEGRLPGPARPPPGMELAAHWAQRVEHAGRPLGVVLFAPRGACAGADASAVQEAFAQALADLSRLGLRTAVLSAPALDGDGNLRSVSAALDEDGAASHREHLLCSLRLAGGRQPSRSEVLDALAVECRRRDVVPVVFVAGGEEPEISGGAEAKSSGGASAGCCRVHGGALHDLVQRVLPSVDDTINGHEAGSWHGVDPQTGAATVVRPDAQAPFAGVAFQTTYLQGGAWKAFDLLVVRGTLQAGQPLINTTTGRHMLFAKPLEHGGGCPGQVDRAYPGDVVRVKLPAADAAPGTGGSLCWWCDPAAPVRMPVLHSQAYALLAGGHCTYTVCLDGGGSASSVSAPGGGADIFGYGADAKPNEEALLGALARTIEEDQSLRIECADGGAAAEDGEVRLTALGLEHLRRVRRRLRETWGVRLDLRPWHVPYRATLRQPVRVCLPVGSGARAVVVAVRVAPLPRGAGVRVTASEEVLGQIGGRAGLDAFTRGVRHACRRGVPLLRGGRQPRGLARFQGHEAAAGAELRGAPRGGPCRQALLPLIDVEVELIDLRAASPYEPAPLPAQLLAAGARCLRRLGAAGGGAAALLVLEPLAEVCVQAPRAHVRRVAADLRARGGRVHAVRGLRPLLAAVEATVPHRRLRRYGRVLASLTASTATFATSDGGYAEVCDADLAGIAAAVSSVRRTAQRPARKGCPLLLWG